MQYWIRPKKYPNQVIEIGFLENGAFLEVWSNGRSGDTNWGFTFLPLKFWRHLWYQLDNWHPEWSRFGLGLGLFSFFFDY